MSEKKPELKDALRSSLTIGTPECAALMGVVGLVLGILFLLLGFWKTLLVIAIMLLGVFIGGVKDKKTFAANIVNKLFPQRSNNFPGSEQAGREKTVYPPEYSPETEDEKKDTEN